MSENDELQPLFTLDLGDNGGLLTPTTLVGLEAWMQNELQIWGRFNLSISVTQVNEGLATLRQAFDSLPRTKNFQTSSGVEFPRLISNIKERIRSTFVDRKLPHSSTALSALLQEMHVNYGTRCVSWFLAAYFGETNGQSPSTIEEWHGLRDGLNYRYPERTIIGEAFKAHEKVFDALRDKTQKLLDGRTISLGDLESATSKLKSEYVSSIDSNKILFDAAQEKRDADFATALQAHEGQMQTIRETFKEQMGLRLSFHWGLAAGY